MPIICAWCQSSVVRSRAALEFPDVTDKEKLGIAMNDYIWWGEDCSGGYGRYTSKIDRHDFLVNLSEGYWNCHNEHESGDVLANTQEGLCKICLDELIEICKLSSERADPPCDTENGSWVGFTSKHVFEGGRKVGPTLLCVAIAKLLCIECGKNDSTIQLITTGTYGWEHSRYDGESWDEDHIILGRGPMVDYIRKGTWIDWVIKMNDYDGEWIIYYPESIMPSGWLTQDGWCCSKCD